LIGFEDDELALLLAQQAGGTRRTHR
jgi:hypothetical protein